MSERINSANKELTTILQPKDKSQLVSVNVAQNKIKTIDVINDYNALTQLIIRNNEIETIPTITISLLSLDISANPFSSIDPILAVTSLVDLTISQCPNLAFTFELSKLENLTSLVAIGNKLTEAEFLNGCKKLQKLDLSNNLIEKVPSAIGKCEEMTSLNLSDNNISAGLHSIGKLQNLVELNLSWNKIKELKKSFYTLGKLTELILYNNEITRIHKNIVGLESLVKLNLKNNYELKTIHSSIGALKKLEEINLDGCKKLLDIPSFKENVELKQFSMNNATLQYVPELPNGCTVSVEYNSITEFRNDLSQSDSLNAPFNSLTKLPELKDTKINRVNICGNNVKDLNLVGINLLALNISYNKLSNGVLPKDITGLTKLRQLYCSNCGLTKLKII